MPEARQLAWPDLIWSHFNRPRFGKFDERVVAAAEAGYKGIGLFMSEYLRLRNDEGRSVADIAAVLDEHDICLAEIEVIRGWSATDAQGIAEYQALEAVAFEMAENFGCRYLQAIGSFEGSDEHAAQSFAGLCDRAAEHGLLVGIEWLPFTNIYSAADAQRLVQSADRPNGGYCVDIWHHKRGANDLSMISALEADKIFAIQMNDGSMTPTLDDYKADCMASRLAPGRGEFECVEFIRTLHTMGVNAPISLEVCSTAMWQMSAIDAARASAEGMRHVLQAALA